MGSNPVWRMNLRKAVTQTVTKSDASTAAPAGREVIHHESPAHSVPLQGNRSPASGPSLMSDTVASHMYLGSGSTPIASRSRIPARF